MRVICATSRFTGWMIGGVPLSFAQEVSSVSGTCVSTQTVHRNLKCGLHGHISRRGTLRTTTQVLSRFFLLKRMWVSGRRFGIKLFYLTKLKKKTRLGQMILNVSGDENPVYPWNPVEEVLCCGNALVEFMWGLTFMGITMVSRHYCDILQKTTGKSIKKLGRDSMLKHGNNLKHTLKRTTKFWWDKKCKDLAWLSTPPELNSPEHLLSVFKRKVEDKKTPAIWYNWKTSFRTNAGRFHRLYIKL